MVIRFGMVKVGEVGSGLGFFISIGDSWPMLKIS